ncbi:BA75_03009T0 [Komagataella pastoris]|uniref:BA75_03009T0 n=1 Tax=Komagataella pastoris TaxID=4922 RepID=A0A1B2JD42_PICPA|nr:BA75_03009T0 [Komagataella pastoris]
MSTWIKGPICGIENCSSRLYRSVDGRRVCRRGHVSEHHMDIDDDDGAFVVTRRLNMSQGDDGTLLAGGVRSSVFSQQQNEGPSATRERAHGLEGRKVCWQCYQYVLRKQAQWLIENHGVPAEFETVVKELWIFYLKGYEPTPKEKVDDSSELERQSGTENRVPSLLHAISIIYLALLRMQVPIFVNDLISWVSTASLPYMRAFSILPRTLQQSIPTQYIRIFEPIKPPIRNELYWMILRVYQFIHRVDPNPFTVDCSLFLFKLNLELLLPLDVMLMVQNCLSDMDENIYELPLLKRGIHTNYHNDVFLAKDLVKIPELRIVGLLICCTKFYFFNTVSTRAKVDITRWYTLINRYNFTFNAGHLSEMIFKDSDDNKLAKWDEDQIDSYLKWFEENLLEQEKDKDSTNMDPAQRRLREVFALQGIEAGEKAEKSSKAFNSAEEKPTLVELYQSLLDGIGNNETPRSDLSTSPTLNSIRQLHDFLISRLSITFGVTEDRLGDIARLCQSFIEGSGVKAKR